MKKFAFSLDRVLAWRQTQLRLEETKLKTTHAELRAAEVRVADLQAERERHVREIEHTQCVTGQELAALGHYCTSTVSRILRLETERSACQEKVTAQTGVVVGKQRDVRLLERLRANRLQTWNTELGRELDQQAGEAFLARWARPSR